jgi:hypothetical protein
MSKIPNGVVCEICGATEGLQRHHRSYDPPIIQYLCVNCHKAVHNHGVGIAGDFIGATKNTPRNWWNWMHHQKQVKRDRYAMRMQEADQEMKVLEKMLRGEL